MTPEPDAHWRHVTQHQSLRDPVNRHALAIALIVAPVVFGALTLRALGTEGSTLAWVLGGVAIPSGVGGWLHPPSRSLRLRAALAAVAIAMGALAATHVYLARRGADRKLRFGYELVLPIVIGGLPGVALYYVLARNERLDAGDQS